MYVPTFLHQKEMSRTRCTECGENKLSSAFRQSKTICYLCLDTLRLRRVLLSVGLISAKPN